MMGTMKPVNRRIRFVFGLFSLFHGGFTFPPLVVKESDVIVMDNHCDFLRKIGIQGNIICTLGHYKDSISVVLEDGNAFVGDAVMNFLHICGIRHRPIYIESLEEVYSSWDLLREQGTKMIYPSHGKPFSVGKLFYKR